MKADGKKIVKKNNNNNKNKIEKSKSGTKLHDNSFRNMSFIILHYSKEKNNECRQ